ncbi:MAG: OmpA family protein [Chthonomonadaceae bacterium]|nr:OmpA family protein [Chthonomonadaceae bacterium]
MTRTNGYAARLRRDTEGEDRQTSHERWLLTYADMITLLAAFFLMLYSMSVMNQGKFTALTDSLTGRTRASEEPMKVRMSEDLKKQRAEYQQALKNLVQFVEQNRMSGRVALRAEERGMVISLVSDDLLFERGHADLKGASVPLLGQVRQILQTMPANTIQIEGHTDNLPIKTVQFPSNWELSTARASAILRTFTEKFGMPQSRFLASGYAETKPLVVNNSETNRVRNRRVDIILLKTEAQRNAELIRRTALEQKNQRDSSPTP